MSFLLGYTLPWTRLRNSPSVSITSVLNYCSSFMSFHIRCFIKQKSRQEGGTEIVNGIKVHREFGRFPQTGLVEEARSIGQIHEMRASVAMHTTAMEYPAIWTIVWMLDKSGAELNPHSIDWQFRNVTCGRPGYLSGILTLIRTIDFILGGYGVGSKGWKGMLSEWEDVLQTLEDELRVPVGAPNHQNFPSLQQLMTWV